MNGISLVEHLKVVEDVIEQLLSAVPVGVLTVFLECFPCGFDPRPELLDRLVDGFFPIRHHSLVIIWVAIQAGLFGGLKQRCIAGNHGRLRMASDAVHMSEEHRARRIGHSDPSGSQIEELLNIMLGLMASLAIDLMGCGQTDLLHFVLDGFVAAGAFNVFAGDMLVVQPGSVLEALQLFRIVVAVEAALLEGLPRPLNRVDMATLAGHRFLGHEILVLVCLISDFNNFVRWGVAFVATGERLKGSRIPDALVEMTQEAGRFGDRHVRADNNLTVAGGAAELFARSTLV